MDARAPVRLCSAAVVGLLMLSPGLARAERPRTIVVIVHARSPVHSLSRAALRSIFLKRTRRWSDGRPILLLNLKPRSATRASFDRLVLDMSPDEAAIYWIKQRVRGLGLPPPSFASARIVQRLVAKQVEAIAYLPLAALLPQAKVRIVKIDGLTPGAARYPLRTGGAR